MSKTQTPTERIIAVWFTESEAEAVGRALIVGNEANRKRLKDSVGTLEHSHLQVEIANCDSARSKVAVAYDAQTPTLAELRELRRWVVKYEPSMNAMLEDTQLQIKYCKHLATIDALIAAQTEEGEKRG